MKSGVLRTDGDTKGSSSTSTNGAAGCREWNLWFQSDKCRWTRGEPTL